MSTKILGTTSTVALLCFFGFGNHVALSMDKDHKDNQGKHVGKNLRPDIDTINATAKTMGGTIQLIQGKNIQKQLAQN